MQTSKEELQSLNEELETVNTELRQKVDELGAANSDLQNLFVATEIATSSSDRSCGWRVYAPATALFHLIETTLAGRSRISRSALPARTGHGCEEVLRALTPSNVRSARPEGACSVRCRNPTVRWKISSPAWWSPSSTSAGSHAPRTRSARPPNESTFCRGGRERSTPFGVGAPDGSLLLFNRAFAE